MTKPCYFNRFHANVPFIFPLFCITNIHKHVENKKPQSPEALND